jgi:DNA-binding MarR family transcriptional regulator
MVQEKNDATQSSILQLTSNGRKCALHLISAGKAVESEILQHLGYEDSAVLKSLLNRLLDSIDPDASALWGEPEK